MEKPKTYKKLLELVNPKDLLEILNFSGINDSKDKEHGIIKREFSRNVFLGMQKYGFTYPFEVHFEMKDTYYDTIIKCIQDFYWWSHEFKHEHAHTYKRVINALKIPLKVFEEWKIEIKKEKER